MAKVAAEPNRADAVANAAADARAAVARLLRLLDPTASVCWLGYEGRAGKGRFPIDLDSVLEPVGDDGLTDGQRTIFRVFVDSPTPLTRKEAARKTGHKVPEGAFGENFRQILRKEKLLKRGTRYTNDASKFADCNSDELEN